jgi:hypothetical protein
MVIPWGWFKDFVQGEQNNLKFSCKFTSTKEHKICNPSNTLTHPKQIRHHFFTSVLLSLKFFFKTPHLGLYLFVAIHCQLGFEMLHMWNNLFSRSQVEMTLIIIGCKTTLHHCVKFSNFQPFFLELLISRLYHPHSHFSLIISKVYYNSHLFMMWHFFNCFMSCVIHFLFPNWGISRIIYVRP